MAGRIKVLFTTNIPVPYRVAFFNELGKYVDLTVAFERRDAETRDKSWLQGKAINFHAVYLRGISYGDDCAFCPEIINCVKGGHYDYVIIGAYYTLTGIMVTNYMRLCGIKFQFSGDGGFVKQEPWWKHKIKKFLQSGGNLYFSPSSAGDDVLKYYSIDPKKIRRYNFTSLNENDIMADVLNMQEKKLLRAKLGIQEKYVVLGVGRLVEFKAWEMLARAAFDVGSNVGFYLIGGQSKGSYYENIFNYYECRNFHVVPFMAKQELVKYFMAADIYAMPSRGDIWGLVINEALAYGLPVVATKGSIAARELVHDGVNGYIVDVDEYSSFVESIKKILANEEVRAVMSRNSLKIIRPYTIQKMAKQYFYAMQDIRGEYE